jgi:hypothetical protein
MKRDMGQQLRSVTFRSVRFQVCNCEGPRTAATIFESLTKIMVIVVVLVITLSCRRQRTPTLSMESSSILTVLKQV